MKRRPAIKIADEFNEILGEIFTEYLQNFSDFDSLTRPVDDDEWWFPEGCTHTYTQKGLNLIKRWRVRMKDIFYKYFPDDVFCVTSHLFRY